MTSGRWKKILALLAIPLILLVAYLTMFFAWRFFGLPGDDEMKEVIKTYFDNYGLLIVFIGALLEGVLLVGQYFPGGFIIFFGVVSANGNVVRAAEVVGVVCISFFTAYYLNYLMGKYGWYKLFVRFGLEKSIEDAKKKLVRHELNAVLSTYWEPNLSSITATAAGILHIPRPRFFAYSAIGILIWETFWGVTVFSFGQKAFDLIGIKFVLFVFIVWVAIILIKHFVFGKGITSENYIP